MLQPIFLPNPLYELKKKDNTKLTNLLLQLRDFATVIECNQAIQQGDMGRVLQMWCRWCVTWHRESKDCPSMAHSCLDYIYSSLKSYRPGYERFYFTRCLFYLPFARAILWPARISILKSKIIGSNISITKMEMVLVLCE